MIDSRNLKSIKEGDRAAYLGSATEDAQIYFDGIREDRHVYAQVVTLHMELTKLEVRETGL